MIYFDNAASTPLFPEVVEEINNTMSHAFGNPSSIHSFGRTAKVVLEEARNIISELIHASPSEIVFTSGGTEANNMALWGCVHSYNIQHIITSRTEHPAVLKPIDDICKTLGVKLSFLSTDKNGQIALSELENILENENEPTLVSLMHANNETGLLLPLKDVSALCAKHNTFFHTDMVQTIGKFHINFKHIPVSFASCSAHKFHGPKGIGFLYINEKNKIKPYILGGSQERNMRAGTENVYLIAGMAKAIELCHNNMEETQKYITVLKNYTTEKLKEFEGVTYNASSDKGGLHTILSINFPELPQTEMLIQQLDIEGIAVSGGSACASGSFHSSHVLQQLNVKPDTPSLRISFSKYNTKNEINKFIEVLRKIVHHEKKN